MIISHDYRYAPRDPVMPTAISIYNGRHRRADDYFVIDSNYGKQNLGVFLNSAPVGRTLRGVSSVSRTRRHLRSSSLPLAGLARCGVASSHITETMAPIPVIAGSGTTERLESTRCAQMARLAPRNLRLSNYHPIDCASIEIALAYPNSLAPLL